MTLTLQELRAKSVATLAGLMPVVREAAEKLIERCYNRGINIRITQGLRTIAEQNELYAQGRTKPGKIVTNAQGGHSNHNYGVAIDFVLLAGGYDTHADKNGDNQSDWMEVVDEAKKLGFAWGGDWASFTDLPHFEMTFGISTAQYRAGKKPTQAQVEAARAKIAAGDEEAMTIQEKIAFDALTAKAAALEARAATLEAIVAALNYERSMMVPDFAKEAVKAAVNAGIVDTPEGGSYDFYRMITILHRKNLF